MEALRLIYKEQLTEIPRKSGPQQREGYGQDYGWVFVSNDCVSVTSCRSYRTLSIFSETYTYYTPNTFYRRDKREEAHLRWLNAIVLDVDVKNGQNDGLALPDLLERIQSAGLPEPTFVVQTPSGGFHIYFVLDKPRKAYMNAIAQYKKLQAAMSEAVGGDRQAVGAGRFFRIPTPQTTIYRTDHRVSFDQLNDWYWMNQEHDSHGHRGALQRNQSLLSHSAVQKLLAGVEKGKRDNTAYTLALAFKAEGYAQLSAENELQEWNARLEYPLPTRIISQKVQSAYKPGSPQGPTSEWIEYLSGERFSYRIWEAAKPRSERKTSHYHEWACDILDTLCSHPSGEISGSQRELAAYWGMSLSTFQQVTKILIELGKIFIEVTGKGRGSRTIIRLIRDSKIELLRPSQSSNTPKKNVPDSNTFILALEVGGSWLRHLIGLRCRAPDSS